MMSNILREERERERGEREREMEEGDIHVNK